MIRFLYMWVGSDLTKGAIFLFRKLEMSSVGQVKAEMIGRSGVLGL